MARKRERIFGAAVLKLSFELRGEQGGEGFRFVYEGVLRDLGIKDEDVDRYIEAHRPEVEEAVRGQQRKR